jgi:hypothetical protein
MWQVELHKTVILGFDMIQKGTIVIVEPGYHNIFAIRYDGVLWDTPNHFFNFLTIERK